MVAYVGNIDASLATGNVAYTSVGFAPSAVLFWGTTRTGAGANEQTAYSGYFGMTDGTTSHCVGMSGVAPTSNNHYVFGDTSCVKMINGSGTILMEAEIVSLDSDGFTLNWTTAAGSGYDVNFLAIAGSEITGIKVGKATISASGATAITGVGFAPDFVLFNYFEGASFPLANLNGTNSVGIGLDTGSAAQANGHATTWRSSIIDSGNSYMSGDSSIMTLTPDNAPLLSGEGQISATGADGFTITMASHSGIDLHVGYLAIAGGSHHVFDERPTGAAAPFTQVETGFGFTPEFVFVHDINVDASVVEGSGASSWEGSAMCVGAADGTRHRFAHWGCDVNGDGGDYQSTTHLIVNANSIDGVDQMATLLADSAVLTSLDSDGLTITWDVYETLLDPLVFGWAGSFGSVVGTFDNKIIYADGITVV